MNIIPGGLACDDRGSLRFVNNFNPSELGIKRMYQVENNPLCEIRAWHGHLVEEKYVYCARGSAIIAATQISATEEGPAIDETNTLATSTVVLSSLQPKVLHIPAGFANGFRMLEPGTILMFYSTSSVEESKSDDYRFPYLETGIFNIKVR